MGRVRFALFGAGRIGSIHFKDLVGNPRASVSWVVETDVNRATQLVANYHLQDSVKVVDIKAVRKVLADSSVDAVLICTPHHTHEELIFMALEAGKPVFCEKPLSVTVPSVIKCYETAKAASLPLMCGFNRRYDPQNRLIYNKVRSGEIGKVRVVKVTSREPRHNTSREYLEISGGIFLDSVVHDIDVSCFQVGEFPVSVYAQGYATNQMFKDCSDIDTAMVTLKYPGGAVACIELSRESDIGSYYHMVEVLGNDGLLETRTKKPVDVIHWSGAEKGGVKLEPSYDTIAHFLDSYQLEIEHFIDVVEGKCDVEVSDKSTVITSIIAAACKVSLDQHKEIDLKAFAKEEFNYIY